MNIEFVSWFAIQEMVHISVVGVAHRVSQVQETDGSANQFAMAVTDTRRMKQKEGKRSEDLCGLARPMLDPVKECRKFREAV